MGTLHFRRIERRRTARVALCVELIVHWEAEGHEKHRVETRTLSVSGYGGMMVLDREVPVGQKMVLIHVNSGQKAECKVVSAKVLRDGTRNVAFEFTSDVVNFWRMCFPVPGAKPLRRAVPVMFSSMPATKMS
jgi:c-di-GMP-binding flagellar brake protein YcgR